MSFSSYAECVEFFSYTPGQPQRFLDCPRCLAESQNRVLSISQEEGMVECSQHGSFPWEECNGLPILTIGRVIFTDGTVVENNI